MVAERRPGGSGEVSGAGGGGGSIGRVGTRRGRRGSQHAHQDRRRVIRGRIALDRQVHVMAELRLVGPTATNPHATAFAAGDGGAVWQRHRGVAAVPADHQSAGRGRRT